MKEKFRTSLGATQHFSHFPLTRMWNRGGKGGEFAELFNFPSLCIQPSQLQHLKGRGERGGGKPGPAASDGIGTIPDSMQLKSLPELPGITWFRNRGDASHTNPFPPLADTEGLGKALSSPLETRFQAFLGPVSGTGKGISLLFLFISLGCLVKLCLELVVSICNKAYKHCLDSFDLRGFFLLHLWCTRQDQSLRSIFRS